MTNFHGLRTERGFPATRSVRQLFTLLFGLFSIACCAYPSHAEGCPASSSPHVTIPFTLIGDHIFISATVNGSGPYQFVVDTGGVDLIDTETAKALRLPLAGSETGHGIGPRTVESGKTTIRELKAGTGTFNARKFYTFDFRQINAMGGVTVAGMIGGSMFRQYVTCFDFEHQRIELIDPAKFDLRRAGFPVPMSVKDSEITVRGAFDGEPGVFQIDTGSASTLSLNSPFVARYKLLNKFPNRVETLSSGVGGSNKAFTVRGQNLVLGAVHIDRPITELSVASQGNLASHTMDGRIGMRALKRYIVTFDFPGARLFLKPFQPAPVDLDTYDRSGLGLAADSSGYRIMSVAKGTPAQAAGLQPGDIIVAVDGRPATEIPLATMRGWLRQRPAGSLITLKVKGRSEIRVVPLTLRDLL